MENTILLINQLGNVIPLGLVVGDIRKSKVMKYSAKAEQHEPKKAADANRFEMTNMHVYLMI